MESFSLAIASLLVTSGAASLLTLVPLKVAFMAAAVLLPATLVLWHEWKKRTNPATDWQQYAPLFGAAIGVVLGGAMG